MKKTLLTFCLSLCALCGMAQTQTNYSEKLVVTIDGNSTDSIPAAITVVDNGDGTCDFSLKNFMLVAGESSMPIGNVDLKGVKMEKVDGVSNISTNQNIVIQPGEDSNYGEDEWIGPALGEVPIVLTGKLTATALYVNIDIDMSETLEQVINVVVGQEKNITTGIGSVKVTPSTNATAIYTLGGVRVSKATKGVYVINGKKVIK
uniref:calycin-like domain-containing protein n=1 Tax=Alloprevotella sp. TaxID=1872471 RepID=UPI0040275207